MLRKLRVVAVLVASGLGLVVQGVGTAAASATGWASAQAACHFVRNEGPSSGRHQHLAGPACQAVCTAPATVPRASAAARSVIWADQRFATSIVRIPAGLSLAPDPFPPRSSLA